MSKLKAFEGFTIWSDKNYKQLAQWYQDTLQLTRKLEINIPGDNAIAFELDPANEMYLWIGYHSEVHGKNKEEKCGDYC